MNDIDYTIEAFGRSIQINNLRFNRHNVISLDMEKVGALLIEREKDRLLVYLATAIPAFQKDIYTKALQICHHKEGMPMDISVGFKDPDQLILAIRLSIAEVTEGTLNQAVKLLFYVYGTVCEQ